MAGTKLPGYAVQFVPSAHVGSEPVRGAAGCGPALRTVRRARRGCRRPGTPPVESVPASQVGNLPSSG